MPPAADDVDREAPRRVAAVLAALTVAVVAAGGLCISLQGWQSSGPDEDVVTAIAQAAVWLDRGELPRHNNLTDLHSHFPPGTAWLALPGTLVFSDVRLVELVGSGILYVASLVGVFLLGRRYFGVAVAVLATIGYGFSAIALDLANHLWPRGHPFFYIWMVYLVGRWVDHRDSRYLGGAVLLFGVGAYVHLELAPAIFIVPAVWAYFRPPVRWAPIAMAIAATFVVWSPYLLFQYERGFIDLQSQLLLRPLVLAEENASVCGHQPGPVTFLPDRADSLGVRLQRGVERIPATADLVRTNLRTRVLGGERTLLLLVLVGLAMASAPVVLQTARASSNTVGWRTLATAAVVVFGLLAGEAVGRWAGVSGTVAATLVAIERASVWAMVGGAVLATRSPKMMALASDYRREWRTGHDSRFMAIALLAPWSVLVLLTESGRDDRMFGVWPLQVLLMVAAAVALGRRTSAGPIRWAGPALVVIALLAANLNVLARTREWREAGWEGVATHRQPGVEELIARCGSPADRYRP